MSNDTSKVRRFTTADLVTVYSGVLLSPRHIAAVYDVIDYVTGVAHMTHQLPRASEIVAPELLRQHPWLADVEIPEGVDTMAKVEAWAAQVAEQWGAEHEVRPLPFGEYVGREPIAELQEMTGDKPIIVVGEPVPHE